MNVSPQHMYRTRYPDTEDLALTFVEEEVGRFDWANNWSVLKARGDLRQKVQAWLAALGIEHDPDAIIAFLDHVNETRAGRWL